MRCRQLSYLRERAWNKKKRMKMINEDDNE
jgi:hypothetical protein